MGRQSGSALLEVAVSVIVLSVALSKLGLSFMNFSRQLSWLENKRQRYTVVAPDLSKIIFSEYLYGGAEGNPPVVNKVSLVQLSTNATAAEAVVTLDSP